MNKDRMMRPTAWGERAESREAQIPHMDSVDTAQAAIRDGNNGSDAPLGGWRTVQSYTRRFRLPTSTRLACHTCPADNSTHPNRRMRTRMYGGVAGADG
jgi:hypothetical protein